MHVFGVMDVGGAELRTIELQGAMRDFEFCFVTLSGRSGELTARIENLGGYVVPIKLSWSFPFQFVSFLRRYRPQALDSHVATFSGFMCLLAAIARVPVRIAHFHSDGDGHGSTWRRRLQRAVMRQLIERFATHVVGVSPSALSSGYRPDWNHKSHGILIPNGTDADRLWESSSRSIRDELSISQDDLLVVHVGRPSAEKNRVRLPNILSAVVERGVAAQLVLIGPRDVEDDQQVLEAARQAGVEDRLHFFGVTEDVGGALRSADVLVLPSRREGLPGVLVEAAAVGTPAVASDTGGAVWLAQHFRHIRCVSLQLGDYDWAQALIEAYEGRPASRQQALAAMASSPFSLRTAAAAHNELYAGVPVEHTPTTQRRTNP